MTKTEMNRRIASMTPEAVAKVEKMWRNTTYTAREVFAFRIPGTGTLANVNAVFQKAREAA
jgi:hypothetical protein